MLPRDIPRPGLLWLRVFSRRAIDGLCGFRRKSGSADDFDDVAMASQLMTFASPESSPGAEYYSTTWKAVSHAGSDRRDHRGIVVGSGKPMVWRRPTRAAAWRPRQLARCRGDLQLVRVRMRMRVDVTLREVAEEEEEGPNGHASTA